MRYLTCTAILVCLAANGVALAQDINPVPFAPADYFDDDTVTLVYDPTGEFWLAHPIDDGGRESSTPTLTTIQVRSSEDFFMEFHWCPGLIDACWARQAFNLEPRGFASLPRLQVTPGLSGEQVSSLLRVGGSLTGGGPLESVDLYVVPEPTTLPSALVVVLVIVLSRHSYQEREK